MAVKKRDFDYDWRVYPTNTVSDEPRALRNEPSGENKVLVKCYRNVIYTWLFHTPLLLNWIDDHHKPRCVFDSDIAQCAICRLRELAIRFWSQTRKEDSNFNKDIDEFWKYAMLGDWQWDSQNDSQEYMEKLFQFLDEQCHGEWTDQLVSPYIYCLRTCKECTHRTGVLEKPSALKAKMPPREVKGLPLEESFKEYHQHQDKFADGELCSECDKRTEHKKADALVYAPPILPIYVEPAYTENLKSFIKGTLSELAQSMAVSSYSDSSLNPNTLGWNYYHLYGVILRSGKYTDTGHYVCAFEQRDPSSWLFFNDIVKEDVQRVDVSRIGSMINEMQADGWRVFLLAYRKMFHLPVQQKSASSTSPKDLEMTEDVQAGTSFDQAIIVDSDNPAPSIEINGPDIENSSPPNAQSSQKTQNNRKRVRDEDDVQARSLESAEKVRSETGIPDPTLLQHGTLQNANKVQGNAKRSREKSSSETEERPPKRRA